MAIVLLTTHLDAPPDRVWRALNTPGVLIYVAHPILQFQPRDPPVFPPHWEDGDYLVGLRWHGFLPLGRQVIRISRPAPKDDVRFLRDNGHSAMIKRWDHLISVAADGEGTLYTDRVDIDAGVLTPIVVAFARRFYAHRQARWPKLVKSGFDDGPVADSQSTQI